MQGTEIKGLVVHPANSRREEGTIDDLILDLDERRVLALAVSRGSSLDSYVIPVGSVQGVGDAVVVGSASAIVPIQQRSDYTPKPTFNKLLEEDAVTESGRLLGKVANIEVDTTNWAITAYDIVGNYTRAFFHGLRQIPAQDVVVTGRDTLLVADHVASE